MTALTGAPAAQAIPDIASRTPGERAPAAWQKELERACTASWFHGPLLPGEARVATVHPGATATVLAAPSQPVHHPPGALHPAARDAGRAHGQLPVAGGGRQHPQMVGESHSHLPSSLVNGGRVPRWEVAEARSCGDSPSGKYVAPCEAPYRANAAPVRIHSEAGPAGLTIWLGIDGDAALVADRSSEVLEALLRQMREAGQRLAAVVCNGKAILGNLPQQQPVPRVASGETS